MALGFFENLKQQPLKERKKATWIISLSLTTVIFALWLVFWSQSGGQNSNLSETKSERDLNRSFSLIADNFGRIFEGVQEQIGGAKEFFSNLPTSTPESAVPTNPQ